MWAGFAATLAAAGAARGGSHRAGAVVRRQLPCAQDLRADAERDEGQVEPCAADTEDVAADATTRGIAEAKRRDDPGGVLCDRILVVGVVRQHGEQRPGQRRTPHAADDSPCCGQEHPGLRKDAFTGESNDVENEAETRRACTRDDGQPSSMHISDAAVDGAAHQGSCVGSTHDQSEQRCAEEVRLHEKRIDGVDEAHGKRVEECDDANQKAELRA